MKKHPLYSNYIVSEDGKVFNSATGRKLKPERLRDGYERVTLYSLGGRSRHMVHRLVAQTYIPNPNGKPQVNHKDMVKHNNHVDNLEWVSAKENINHAWDSGNLVASKGENKGNAVLTDSMVYEICSMMEQGCRNVDICKHFSIDKHLVEDIRKGQSWEWVSKKFDIRPSRGNRLSPNKVVKIAEMLQNGSKMSEVSRELGVSYKAVQNIKNRKTHSDLTRDYDF